MKTPYWLLTTILASSLAAGHAEQTGKPRRILAGDDSTRRLAIVGTDGSLEWEIPITAAHDAQVLANGNVIYQDGWQRIVEVTPDKKKVWEYDSGKMNGNAGKPIEVHAFQRLGNGLTMIAESGPARIIEVDKEGWDPLESTCRHASLSIL